MRATLRLWFVVPMTLLAVANRLTEPQRDHTVDETLRESFTAAI